MGHSNASSSTLAGYPEAEPLVPEPAAEALTPTPQREVVAATVGISAATGWLLALIRIAAGFFWYQSIFLKLPGHAGGFHKGLEFVATSAWVPGFGRIVRTLLVPSPNWQVFALLIFLLEGSIAISLLFGLFTRLGGLAGVLWATLLFCGTAYAPHIDAWSIGMVVLLDALVALTASGRWLGVDRWLRPHMLRRAAGSRLAHVVALAE
jgi:hypothetical protein